jgi:hypothetical protein
MHTISLVINNAHLRGITILANRLLIPLIIRIFARNIIRTPPERNEENTFPFDTILHSDGFFAKGLRYRE